MTILNVDFLAGCLCGALVIPALVRLLSTGRLDGWRRAPCQLPPVGETVLAYHQGRIAAVTYNGPEGGGEIPEDAALYWRKFPLPPWRT